MKHLILLLAIVAVSCNSPKNEKRPEDYVYKHSGSNRVYFQRENKDTIFCVLKPGSYQTYYCEDNGYFYVYSAECPPVNNGYNFEDTKFYLGDSIGIGIYPDKSTNWINIYKQPRPEEGKTSDSNLLKAAVQDGRRIHIDSGVWPVVKPTTSNTKP